MDKADREKCWAARDAYFACIETGTPAPACAAQRTALEGSCPASWVKHFEQRRIYLQQREMHIKALEAEDKRMRK